MDENVEITKRLGEIDIIQRSSDGYINATFIEEQLDNDYLEGTQASVMDIIEAPGTQKLIEDMKGTSVDDGKFYEEDDNENIWISPALLLPFSMQISSKLELEIIEWFYNSRMINNL